MGGKLAIPALFRNRLHQLFGESLSEICVQIGQLRFRLARKMYTNIGHAEPQPPDSRPNGSASADSGLDACGLPGPW
jgi:hypothetical protein